MSDLDGLLRESIARRGVVGASLAVAYADDITECAAGLVNAATGVAATTDSVFQIGSITKVFTTTLIMQLRDAGLLELDTPVVDVLPEFQLADPAAARTIDITQLLTHTSGMDGDHFLDTGPGDDCVERFVVGCAALPQVHRPGRHFSYCNAGFVIAGRIVEKLTGLPWHRALRQRILGPLGLSTMGTEPEEAILHRAAVGHVNPTAGRPPVVIPVWRLARSNGPAGATPFARARDLIAFARTHLDEAIGPDGGRVLSESSAREMQRRQIDLPPWSIAAGWGLGWMHFDWDGEQMIGHDGSTIGQTSYLRMHPPSGTVVSLLTTGGPPGGAAAVSRDVFAHVFGSLVGASPPPPPDAMPTPVDLAHDPASLVGTYRRLAVGYRVESREGRLWLTARGLKPPMNLLPDLNSPLRPIAERVYAVEEPGALVGSPVLFEDPAPDEDQPFIGIGGRLTPRVGP